MLAFKVTALVIAVFMFMVSIISSIMNLIPFEKMMSCPKWVFKLLGYIDLIAPIEWLALIIVLAWVL